MIRLLFFAVFTLSICVPAAAGDFVFFITSNLEGKLSLDPSKPGQMMLTLQSLYHEREGRTPVLFIDTGNAFHPGALSRYSYGSVTYDYLSMNGCAATVVSSHDLRLGIETLTRLDSSSGKEIILSANIKKNKSAVFKPYTVVNAGSKKIALIGLSNDSSVIDIAEQNLQKFTIDPYDKVMDDAITAIEKNEKCDAIVVISGFEADKNASLMRKYPKVSLVISGGDSPGDVYGNPASQIILPDGRRMILAGRKDGYYRAECSFDGRLTVDSFSFEKPKDYKIVNESYTQFVKRLLLWIDRYKSEEQSVFDKRRPFKTEITQEKVANLMRDKFRTEIGILRNNSFAPFDINESSTNFGIVQNVVDDYFLYTFKMKGSDIVNIAGQYQGLTVKGITDDRINGRKINPDMNYTVTSTQSAYEFFKNRGLAGEEYKNKWISISDLIINDLGDKAVLRRNDFSYLESRYTFLLSMSLKNSYSKERVSAAEDQTVPVGMSERSSRIWSLDDSLSFVAFNDLHRFELTPSICFSSEKRKGEDIEYPNNLMKGILVYRFNLSDFFQPYHKSQYESIVRKVEDRRPAVLRETLGADFEAKYFKSKLGAGFEKKYNQDAEDPIYGLECTMDANVPLILNFSYRGIIDSFFARGGLKEQNYYRFLFTNCLSYGLSSYASLSAQHKYYLYREYKTGIEYTSRIFSISFDVNADFKLF